MKGINVLILPLSGFSHNVKLRGWATISEKFENA